MTRSGRLKRLDLLRSCRVIWRYGDKFLLLERLNQPRPVDQTDSQTGSLSGFARR